jgi:hypothetical protein
MTVRTAGSSTSRSDASSRSSGRDVGTSWLSGHSRKVRLRRYARAMGWDVTTSGAIVGEIDGVSVRSYEERGRSTVIELVAPGVLPRMEMVAADRHIPQVSDGMREVHLGDRWFEEVYVVRADEPWMARAVIDEGARRALLAAPVQTWITRDDRLVARSRARIEPLDLFARATALRVLLLAVPWEAYDDPWHLPSQVSVQEAVDARRSQPVERQPSMPRYA